MMDDTNALGMIEEAKKKQPKLTDHLMKVVGDDELSHAYLFSGFHGSGKLAVSTTVAMRLYCKDVQPDGYPCGKCQECIRIAAYEHPDVLIVKPDGRSIKIDQVRQLKKEFSKSGVEGNRKVFIIDAANTMTESAANGLLKFIEEPNDNVSSFLLTDDYRQILPTIISRTQLVEFPQIDEADLKKYAEEMGIPKTSVQLVIDLTNDIADIDKMCQDNWLGKTKKQLELWFKFLVNDDYRAFTTVQKDLMPFAGERYYQQLMLAMIYQLFKDVFEIKYKGAEASQLGFGDQYDVLAKMASQLSDQQLINIIDMILRNTKKQNINVSFQNILEVITLACLAIIEE